ncbi:MAG: crotonase/enoyl-CoA hydratase family protein [Pseudomonadales bacterium]|nr:crotonase/enoyl-CoA hydratase family protein [Pseudomonadales bacterium]
MSYQCFDVEIENNIAHLRMKRPEKRNSMIPAFWNELPAIIEDIDENVKARVIVISSTGPHFTAGLDLDSFVMAERSENADPVAREMARRQRPAGFYQHVQKMQRSFSVLENCRIPVLAAIQGGAIGGGVDLITACDMRYMTADGFITVFEINIGMTADVGTFPRLVKLIPEGLVRELAYTGRRMPAEEARQAGLVNAVYPDQEAMLKAVMNIAADIASKAPLAIAGCKRMINYARDHSTADGLDYISIWNASMLQPAEMQEAIRARGESRDGEFADLPPMTKTV